LDLGAELLLGKSLILRAALKQVDCQAFSKVMGINSYGILTAMV